MVAVRNAHLYNNENFNLQTWLDHLGQDDNTRQQLLQVYQYCDQLKATEVDKKLLLWRGREMIEILVSLSMDCSSLIAAQLFPFVSSQTIDKEIISQNYSPEISKLVSGVNDIAAIGQLNAAQSHNATEAQVDNVRRMLLAMVDDFRCVIIKLAERICNLIEVKKASRDTQVALAKECSNIYAPLANRLGIGQLKWEIEDYAFKYQHPHIYKQIASLLAERRIDRELYIRDFLSDLSAKIKLANIEAEISGRPKHIYSIWRKMQKKNLVFDELFDVRAVRIITKKLQDCYATLGVIHTQYRHLPNEFDDYVANPKPNGYQSIHTVILGPQGKTIEIQIRTKQMHEESELGVAAHWKYKEGAKRSGYDEKITWLRKLLDWQEEMSASGEMIAELRSQVFDDRIYAFTPRGDVVNLPIGATPLDFAYHIHSEIGHRCIGAKVGGRIVPFTYKLSMGEQVEIITQKNPNPSRDWLNPMMGFVNSSRARAKIHAWFRKQSREKNLEAGREILDRELSKLQFSLKDAKKYALSKFGVNSLDDLFVSIGSGDLRINQVINYINAQINKPTAAQEDEQALAKIQDLISRSGQQRAKSKDAVVVEGIDNLMTHLARCCYPIPGDSITGYITQGRGIAVHRSDCEQLNELRVHLAERIIDTVWGHSFTDRYNLNMRIEALERHGLLKDITALLTHEKIKLISMKNRIDHRKHLAIIDLTLELGNLEIFEHLSKKLALLKDIIHVTRMR